MDLEALLARLDTLCWRLDIHGHASQTDMFALADEAALLAPTLEEGGRERLFAAVQRAVSALDRARARVQAQIHTLSVGKRAGRAYLGERP